LPYFLHNIHHVLLSHFTSSTRSTSTNVVILIFVASLYALCSAFLSRVSTPMPHSNSVCLLVRPSVCLPLRHDPIFYGNGLTYCQSFFTVR